MNYHTYMDTILGKLLLIEDGNGVCGVHFASEEQGEVSKGVEQETYILKQAKNQLNEYLAGKRKVFQLPLSLHGTEFQRLVWEELQKIPYGETRSYKEVAQNIKRPKACRAVGMANHRNPVAIIVPCHRVIGADNSLTGYGGGLDIKSYLLKLERTFTLPY